MAYPRFDFAFPGLSARPRFRIRRLLFGLSFGIGAPLSAVAAPLVINELDYDQPGTDRGEFVELKNTTASALSLLGHRLQLINGSTASAYRSYDLPDIELAAGDYYVICGDSANVPNCDLDVTPNSNLIQNGPVEAVALFNGEALVDSLSYEGDTAAPFTEGSGVSGGANSDSNSLASVGLSRWPDGSDSDDNSADFRRVCITPGAANSSQTSDCNTPPPGDSTPPVITATVSGPLGENGWYIGDVAVRWSVIDSESAISATDGCGDADIVSDTAELTVTCEATSEGGTSRQSVIIKRDATAPAIAIISPAHAESYPLGVPVAADWSASDALSGLAASAGTTISGASIDTATVGAKVYSVTAQDLAGNLASLSHQYTVLGGGADGDADGIPDNKDNCPATPNADQANFDGDVEGDACDADDDNDGTDDLDDAFPRDAQRSSPALLSIPLRASEDDSEEGADGRHESMNSSDLEMSDNGGREQLVGLRFSVVELPPGAQIHSAWIQFSADESNAAATELSITAQDSSDAQSFSASFADIGLRQRTQSGSVWAPAPWVAGERGEAQRTPELAAIVQELVNRPGWQAGNAMAFIIEGEGKRVAVSFDGDSAQAAVLHVRYAAQCASGSPDSDGDGQLDACDPDDDNDGVSDTEDAFPLDPSESLDTDGDGVGDHADSDDDNDGVNDVDDDFPLDPARHSADESFEIEVQIAQGSDDAEEWVNQLDAGPQAVDIDSGDLELSSRPDGEEQFVGLRFQNVSVPPGVSIERAWIQFSVDEVFDSAHHNTRIWGEANANPATFLPQDGNISQRLWTSAEVDWDAAPWERVGDRGPAQRTPDLAAIVQELIAQPGWRAGNAMAFIIGGEGRRTAVSFDGSAEAAATLHIRYSDASPRAAAPQISPDGGSHLGSVEVSLRCATPGAQIHYSVGPIGTVGDLISTIPYSGPFFLAEDAEVRTRCSAQGYAGSEITSASFSVTSDPGDAVMVFERRLQGNADDAEENLGSGSVDLDSSDLEMVDNNGQQQLVGLRFAGIAVPRGAVIRRAWLQFTADEAGYQEPSLVLHGEAVDNAAAFDDQPENVSARSLTVSSASWAPPVWDTVGESDVAQRTVDLSAVVQEIVNRVGWASGNAVAFVVSGSGKRVAVSREGAAQNAPLLRIEYSMAP